MKCTAHVSGIKKHFYSDITQTETFMRVITTSNHNENEMNSLHLSDLFSVWEKLARPKNKSNPYMLHA